MAQKLPPFLRQEGDSLLYNGDGEFIFYIPDNFFGGSKNPIAEIVGSYVSTIGVCDYCIVSKNGAKGKVKPFRFPTMFLCKPSEIETVRNIKLSETSEETDYKVLHFKDGDEVVSQMHVPKIVDNVEQFIQLMVITGRIPTSIRYDIGHEYFPENMNLNASPYGINMQLFGILWAELCRDPKDISRPFCLTDMKDMNGYKPVSIKATPNYVSPYVALTSENFDESLRSAILIDDDQIQYSPLEKIVTT